MKLPKGFWDKHPDAVKYVEANWMNHDDFSIAIGLSITYLNFNAKPEQVRNLRRRMGWVKTTSSKEELFERDVFAGDLHIPFHDEKLIALFFIFLKYFKPHKLWLLMDLLDWYPISDFSKDPKRMVTLQDDINVANAFLDDLQKLVPKIEACGGNHEYRMIKYLRRHPELSSLDSLRVQTLLKFNERGIRYHSYMSPPVRYHKLQIHHGSLVRKYSGWTAKGHFEKYGGNGIVGHSHRMGNFIKRTTEGICGWYENGCMCSLKPEYLDFADWVQGWSVAYFTKKDLFHLEQIPVIDHKFLFQGRLFEAK